MRNVFVVDSYLITEAGVFSHASGYPKSYDSANYGGVDQALLTATGAFANAWGAACTKEGMQIQHITLTDMTGYQLDRKVVGTLPDDNTDTTEETETTTE